jgi:predicted DCC family thiol-disulfide oxidoreductase YuxK
VARAILIYDGECPFCSRYVKHVRLRRAVGELELVDARRGGAEVEKAKARGLRLDDGMILHLEDRYYHGADCLNRLALMSSRSNTFNRLNYFLFRSGFLSRFCYPILRSGRNLALRLLGRSMLGY